MSVQGQAGARGLRLKIATGELPIFAVRLLSLPSGQMLLLAVDSQFAVTENGKKVAHAQGTASPLATLITNLRRAEFTVQIPPRPQGDDRLQRCLVTVGPEGGEEGRLIADAKVDSRDFSLCLWPMDNGKMRSCCQGSSADEMGLTCQGTGLSSIRIAERCLQKIVQNALSETVLIGLSLALDMRILARPGIGHKAQNHSPARKEE